MPRIRAALVLTSLLTTFLALAHELTPPAGAQAEGRTLALGDVVERELSGGESHSYRLALAAGQFLHVSASPKIVGVVLRLSDAAGRPAAEIKYPYGPEEPTRISFVTNAAGDYKLEVYAQRTGSAHGSYRLAVEDMRSARPEDESLVAAQGLFEEAARLKAEETPEENRLKAVSDFLGSDVKPQGSPKSRAKAFEKYRESLPLWRAAGSLRGEAFTLYAMVGDAFVMGEYQLMLEYAGQLLPVSRVIKHPALEAVALNGISGGYVFTGDNQKSIEYSNLTLQLCRDLKDRACEAGMIFNNGYCYLMLGDYEKARAYYAEALAIFRAIGDRVGEGMTLHHFGWLHAETGDYRQALDYNMRALPLLAGQNFFSSYAFNNIAYVYRSTGDYRSALEYSRKALQAVYADGNRRGEAYTLDSIGHVYSSMGDAEGATEHYAKALSIWRAVGDRDGEAGTLAGIARVERDRGNLAEARARIEAALNIVESLRNKISGDAARASFFAVKRNYYEFYTDLLMRMHAREPSKGYAAEALQASERGRARSLLDTLIEARADIRQGVDPALLEQERGLQRQLEETATRLRLLDEKRAAERDAAKRDLDALVVKYQELQTLIRLRSPRYAALAQPRPLTLREIQSSVLDPDTLLLEYALGEERSYLFAVTPASFRTYELPARGEVENTAREVYELLTARNRRVPGEAPEAWQRRVAEAERGYLRAAERLSRMLLEPAAGELGDKKLLVVAEGALQYVPFAALPAPVPLGAKRTGVSTPLVAGHEVVTLPSASTVAVLRSESRARTPGKALGAVAVLADPVFDADDPRLGLERSSAREQSAQSSVLRDVVRAADEAGVRLERLRASGDEAERIAALAPKAQVLKAVGLDANKARAAGPELSRYRILHFATHALVNSRHPELSGIVLSLVDEAGRPRDGFFRLHEIYNLAPRLGADLVVLSACQTALGKEIKGEGLVGLTRGFMYAGAPRVMASLWRVDDQATAELMGLFYEGMLQRGLPASRALREAQARMAARRPSPYYWAAFALQGEWRP